MANEVTMSMEKPYQEKSKSGSVTNYEPSTFGPLKYPMTLSRKDFFPDAVCFTIMKRIGMRIDDIAGSVGSAIALMTKAVVVGFGDVEVNKADQSRLNAILDEKGVSDEKKRQEYIAATEQIAKAQDKELPGSFYEVAKGGLNEFFKKVGSAQQGVRDRKAVRTKQLKTRAGGGDILGSIYMNMPAGVQFNDKANWGPQDLGMIGQGVKTLITGGGTGAESVKGAAVGAAGNVAAAGVTGIGSLVARMGLKGGLVGMAVGAAAAGSTIQRGGEAALGVSMNPYMEMMFSGVAFREYQFDFVMRPRSATEFGQVDQIIKMFREHSRPSWVGGKLGKSFMNYPMVYNIQFLTTEGESDSEQYILNPNVPKLKTCVCDSVTTNYAPQNMWTAHEKGVPVAITLGLHFQETELVMAQDVQKEGY